MASTTLGILDWGIGGLGCLRLIRTRFPDLPVVYWSDSGFTPYGKVPPEILATRLDAVRTRLAAQHGVTHLIVACNAASTVLDLLPTRQANGANAIPTLGVIGPGVQHVLDLTDATSHIGVVGGQRTVDAQAWLTPLVAAGRRVTQAVAQPVSALVEAGQLDSTVLHAVLDRHLSPIRIAGITHLVLACTHYPVVAHAFAEHVPGVTLIDPIAATVEAASRAWPLDRGVPGGGSVTALTTGAPRALRKGGMLGFGVILSNIAQVTDSAD